MSRGGWSGNREKQAANWVRKHHGPKCFAPFTGQDWRAYAAWIHCLELWFGSDAQGQVWTLEALRSCLSCAQPKCWPLFKASIPAIGDWSHEEEIWGKIAYAFDGPKLVAFSAVAEAAEQKGLHLALVPKPGER